MTDGRSALSSVEFNAMATRLDELIREFEIMPYPAVRERVFEALQAIDAIHREALGRLVARITEDGYGDVLERAREDPVIQTLLVLYDLAPAGDLPELPSAEDTRNFIALDQVKPVPRRPKLPDFVELAPVEQVPPGTLKDFQVGELRILLANVSGEYYAVRDLCPGSMAPLHLGSFTPPVIVCPWHNEAYDIRSGKRVDGQAEPKLSVLPIFVSSGVVKLARESVLGGGRLNA